MDKITLGTVSNKVTEFQKAAQTYEMDGTVVKDGKFSNSNLQAIKQTFPKVYDIYVKQGNSLTPNQFDYITYLMKSNQQEDLYLANIQQNKSLNDATLAAK